MALGRGLSAKDHSVKSAGRWVDIHATVNPRLVSALLEGVHGLGEGEWIMAQNGADIRVSIGAGVEHLKRLSAESECRLVARGHLLEDPEVGYFLLSVLVPKTSIRGFDDQPRQFVIGPFDLCS